MARLVSLGAIKTKARLYADQRGANVAASGFIDDTELDLLVNDQIAELYDLLVSAFGHEYYMNNDGYAISVVSGTASYQLPSNFYQLYSVTLEWASDNHELVEPLNRVTDRQKYNNYSDWDQYSYKAYRISGSQDGYEYINFVPAPTSAVTCRIRYVPHFQPLTSDSDVFNGVNGWDKLVALGVAMEMLEIEEEGSSSRLQGIYERQYKRIQDMADEREREQTFTIQQVNPERPFPWYPLATVVDD